ncbi:MAG: hypothetical protein LBT20_02085 [Clostridiales bacterium]|jgi:DNA-directed RNA polymerase specialized sigma24 family protein|nr:hypothetical protein [Clostridiales bacterium]
MESKNLWVRVAVAAYRGVPVIAESLEKFIDRAAAKSGGTDCLSLFETLAEKLDRKNRLVNLKCVLDDAVGALREESKTIILRRIEGIPFESIAEELGISLRAIFRHYESALSGMAYHMTVKGFSEEWFMAYFKGDPYIEGLWKRYERDV